MVNKTCFGLASGFKKLTCGGTHLNLKLNHRTAKFDEASVPDPAGSARRAASISGGGGFFTLP
jgi:hypothetical protein